MFQPEGKVAATANSGSEAYCLLSCSAQLLAVSGEPVVHQRPELDEFLASEQFARAVARLFESQSHQFSDSILLEWSSPPAVRRVELRLLKGANEPFILMRIERQQTALSADPLTGLPDRRGLARRFLELRTAQGGPPPVAVLFADLDDFKSINDRFGHAAGDRALAEMARRMSSCVRERDLVARHGGDEFVVLLNGVATLEEAHQVVQRLKAAAAQPLQVNDVPIQLGVTIGIALALDESQSLEQLVEAADRAMYARKRPSKSLEIPQR